MPGRGEAAKRLIEVDVIGRTDEAAKALVDALAASASVFLKQVSVVV
jgi:hypothetical protein